MHACRFLTVLSWIFLSPLGMSRADHIVDFQRHVQPIFEERCIECHGPKEAKNGLRVDELDELAAYLEPGDSSASSLWTDYLTASDPDMLMPPATATEPAGLPIGELLVVKTWIDEGAEGVWSDPASGEGVSPQAEPASEMAKWWAFLGIFHPATTHLPVALLLVSTLFVFLSFFKRESFEPAAYHCLWIGALGAVVACLAGWSYATYKGYVGVGIDLQNSPIDRHRWAGVFVALFAILVIPVARSVRRVSSVNGRIVWLMASMILTFGVALTGYQGGDLMHGENHYMQYYRQLFPLKVTESVLQPPQNDEEPVSESQPESLPSDNTEEIAPVGREQDELSPQIDETLPDAGMDKATPEETLPDETLPDETLPDEAVTDEAVTDEETTEPAVISEVEESAQPLTESEGSEAVLETDEGPIDEPTPEGF